MTVVVDASTVAAWLLDVGELGAWAESIIRSEPLVAPHSLPAEVANALRRAVLQERVRPTVASGALDDLLALPIDLLPFAPFADRVWELRSTVTPHDAWYVALAEALDATLATLDVRLTRAPGTRCRFATP